VALHRRIMFKTVKRRCSLACYDLATKRQRLVSAAIFLPSGHLKRKVTVSPLPSRVRLMKSRASCVASRRRHRR
jgi:hypothetical protein